MIRIGVLSDTHLSGATEEYKRQVQHCFAETDVIFHAGDLTELGVLDVFGDRQVHGVCGNMCGYGVGQVLPRTKLIELGGFSFGLAHGAGFGHDIEARLWNEFGPVDCIVYGHTHRPVCHRSGPVLFVNPGSFTSTGRHGSRGTYAIIEAGEQLRAVIREIPI